MAEFQENPALVKFQPGDLVRIVESSTRFVVILKYVRSFNLSHSPGFSQVYGCVWLTGLNREEAFFKGEMYFHSEYHKKYELLARSAT